MLLLTPMPDAVTTFTWPDLPDVGTVVAIVDAVAPETAAEVRFTKTAFADAVV
jgi:hypothetical protein